MRKENDCKKGLSLIDTDLTFFKIPLNRSRNAVVGSLYACGENSSSAATVAAYSGASKVSGLPVTDMVVESSSPQQLH